ncbi:MAG: glycosyltransferase N-terminal domain-containing protein [Candidatus Krumholzibacteriia bacterium]
MNGQPGPALRLYRSTAPLVAGVAETLASFSPKLAAGIRGRRGLLERSVAAADRLRGCVWVHVTSVGEYEQARPVIAAIRDRLGAAAPPVAVTHFSPSGWEFARRRPCADWHDYLPLDRPADMRRLVRAWQPRLLLFVKFDCWPNLVLEAHAAGVPLFLLAATLQPPGARLHPLARPLFRDVFGRFQHVGAVSEEDRRRFVDDLDVRCPVSVTGDTRAEQVIRRYEESEAGSVAARLLEPGGRVLVLGSTWPPDEQLWLPVLPELLGRYRDLRVVLAPHEPLPHRLAALEADLDRRGIAHRRLSALMDGAATGATAATAAADAAGAAATASGPAASARCVLVDSVGVLAEIYRAGTLAYVGGSFTTGVHNTMEPAVASLPVMFGPRIQNAEEAARLVRREAGFVLRTPADARGTADALLSDPDRLTRCGEAARAVVLEQRGATARSLAVLEPALVPESSPC